MPRISVIIPAYNSQKTIKQTIESVVNQTFTDWELIVVDDGSEDSTFEAVYQFQDCRIQAFSYPHAGANVSRNRGLAHAVGEFVSFLDSDDLWTNDKLESQLKALEENPTAKVTYSWTDYIDENSQLLFSGRHTTLNGDVYENLLESNFLENGSNPLICKKSLNELGGFDESLVAAQDWDMWLRLAARHHFVAVPSVQILYRVSANSLSTNLTRQEKASLQVLEKAYSTSPYSVQHLRRKSFINLYKYLTWKALQKPFKRQKGLAAAKFIWKYVKYDSLRFKNGKLTLILLVKISIIILLPSSLSTVLLTRMKKEPE